MEQSQAQAHKAESLPVDKRTKGYKEAISQAPASPQKVPVGFVHLHGPLFFAGKNFKDRIDVRSDKTPDGQALSMEYDRNEKELVIRGGKYESFIPSSNIVSYAALSMVKKIPQAQTTSNVTANPSLNAQVSGPHDHVFAGLGQGQTGVGGKVK